MVELSLQSRMARMKLKTTLMLLKSSTVRTAEKIQNNKREVLVVKSKSSLIFVCIFVFAILISGLISLLGLYSYIFCIINISCL